MSDFKTFRDVEASLWQSAVAEAITRVETPAAFGVGAAAAVAPPQAQLAQPDHPFARAAERAGVFIARAKAMPAVAFAAAAAPAPGAPEDPADIGVVAVAEAPRFPEVGAFLDSMRLRFGPLDPRWIEALRNYHRYLQGRSADVPYRSYRSLDDFVFDGLLPTQGRVALMADWGTGMPIAVGVLQQIATHDPDIVVHLGDIYYSGQQDEVERRFLQPCRDTFAGPRPRIFTLAGNHDMYSGGAPYYQLLDQLGQPASYFCLRNANWQVIAVDTGRNSDVGDRVPTSLQDSEVAWVRDKIERAAGRRTIVLSHHQFFSPYERIGGGFFNPRLKEQLGPFLPADTVWYWGHEHDLILFGAYQGVRGRCIGHGAIPVPYRLELVARGRIDDGSIPVEDVAHLARNGLYYTNGYMILEFHGPAAMEVYYQYPGDADELFRRGL
jgi:hypothetical protein